MRKNALFLALTFCALRATAQDLPSYEQYNLRVEYREWRSKLLSEIQKGSGVVPGSLINLTDDLGIPDDRTFEVRGAFQIKQGHKLKGSYSRVDYRGDQVVDRNLRFGDTTYFRTTEVFTTLKGAFYSGDYEMDLAKGPWGYFGAMIGGRFLDADMVVVDPDRGQRETEKVQLPIPTLGLAFRYYIGKVSLSGEFAGLTVGSRGHLYEGDAAVRLHFSDRLAGMGGYRVFKLKGVDGEDNLSFRMSGFTFGGEISF